MGPEASHVEGRGAATAVTLPTRRCCICFSSGRRVTDDLSWCYACDLGWSVYTFNNDLYDSDYMHEYIQRRKSDMGIKLNKNRLKRVLKRVREGCLVDFGCGVGAFGELAAKHFRYVGIDVSKEAIEYCNFTVEGGRFIHTPGDMLTGMRADVVTFFDSLEHVSDPDSLIQHSDAKLFVVVMPLYTSPKHVLESKHFKPFEHLWYFTVNSLERLFAEFGYKMSECNGSEIQLGREDVHMAFFERSRETNHT